MKTKKSQLELLLTPPVLILITIIILAFFLVPRLPSFGLAITGQQVEFAGFTWTASGDGSVVKEEDFVVLKTSRNSPETSKFELRTEVTNVDELLIIADSSMQVSSTNEGSTGSNIQFCVEGSISGKVCDSFELSFGSSEAGSKSVYFEAQVFDLKNNFDGTWSSIKSLGVGDVFIRKGTQEIKGDKVYLTMTSRSFSLPKGSSSATSKVYNVVVKESSFAVCKADEVWQDLNDDGIPQTNECFDLDSIILKNEEAIKESFDEKFARIEAELLAKNNGLTTEIENLKQQIAAGKVTSEEVSALQARIDELQLQLAETPTDPELQAQIDELRQEQLDSGTLTDQVSALEAELKDTKAILADVQAGDKSVVGSIEAEEKFERPGFFKEIWNKIIAFFKNLFG